MSQKGKLWSKMLSNGIFYLVILWIGMNQTIIKGTVKAPLQSLSIYNQYEPILKEIYKWGNQGILPLIALLLVIKGVMFMILVAKRWWLRRRPIEVKFKSVESYRSQAEEVYESLTQPTNNRIISITGAWGVGKSYFLEQFLEVYRQETPRKIYQISCFGLTTREQLIAEIYKQIDAQRTSWQKFKQTMTLNVSGVTLKRSAEIPTLDLHDIEDDALFIFDDVERVVYNEVPTDKNTQSDSTSENRNKENPQNYNAIVGVMDYIASKTHRQVIMVMDKTIIPNTYDNLIRTKLAPKEIVVNLNGYVMRNVVKDVLKMYGIDEEWYEELIDFVGQLNFDFKLYEGLRYSARKLESDLMDIVFNEKQYLLKVKSLLMSRWIEEDVFIYPKHLMHKKRLALISNGLHDMQFVLEVLDLRKGRCLYDELIFINSNGKNVGVTFMMSNYFRERLLINRTYDLEVIYRGYGMSILSRYIENVESEIRDIRRFTPIQLVYMIENFSDESILDVGKWWSFATFERVEHVLRAIALIDKNIFERDIRKIVNIEYILMKNIISYGALFDRSDINLFRRFIQLTKSPEATLLSYSEVLQLYINAVFGDENTVEHKFLLQLNYVLTVLLAHPDQLKGTWLEDPPQEEVKALNAPEDTPQ